MEGPSLDVSLAFLDIFMVALTLSGSLVSGGRQGASPPGHQKNWTWFWCRTGGESLICMQSGSEKLAGPPSSVLVVFLAFLLQLPSSLALCAVASALLLKPPCPLCPFQSPELPILYSSSGSLPP